VTSALIFIIHAFAQLFLFVLLLRFWLPWFGADFRNPIAQAILKLTSPLVVPLRRIVPPIGRIDTATLLVAFVIQYLAILVILALGGNSARIAPIALTSILDLAMLSIRLFVIAIIIGIVLSWVAPHNINPATMFIRTISEPLLRPFRRLIPPMGGIDISPVFALILLMALSILLAEMRPLPI
jgi:YggT family protein